MRDLLPQDLSTSSYTVARYNEAGTCLVLQYHRVASLCFDPLQLAVEPYHFEQQMEYLAQNFNVVSMDEMKYHLETSRPFRRRTVAVTFDGGYSDVLYTAKDVLQRYNIPATVFTSSAHIIEGGHYWWKELEDFLVANHFKGQLALEIDRQICKWPLVTQLDRFQAYEDLYSILSNKTPSEQRTIIEQLTASLKFEAEELDNHGTMNAQELRKLEEGRLVTIGGHTHSYVKLSALPKWRQIEEILRNKDILEEILGHNIEYFSYPFGSDNGYTADTIDILENIGFSLACGNSYGAVSIADKTSHYELPRVKVGNWNTFTFYKFLRRFFD
jgi:peptidoglycan/xylan/chitin deacetylase (PgdA/CDA1 family)